jgi:hypothetical protein
MHCSSKFGPAGRALFHRVSCCESAFFTESAVASALFSPSQLLRARFFERLLTIRVMPAGGMRLCSECMRSNSAD